MALHSASWDTASVYSGEQTRFAFQTKCLGGYAIVNRKRLFEIRATLQERERTSWLGMSNEERTFHCAWEFFSEVNSGGIHRYFFYHGADHAHETVTALQQLGFENISAILSSIMSSFPGGDVPQNVSKRQEMMDHWPDEDLYRCERLAGPVYDVDPEPALWSFYERNQQCFSVRTAV